MTNSLLLKMAYLVRWFTELKDGDSPVCHVSLPEGNAFCGLEAVSCRGSGLLYVVMSLINLQPGFRQKLFGCHCQFILQNVAVQQIADWCVDALHPVHTGILHCDVEQTTSIRIKQVKVYTYMANYSINLPVLFHYNTELRKQLLRA